MRAFAWQASVTIGALGLLLRQGVGCGSHGTNDPGASPELQGGKPSSCDVPKFGCPCATQGQRAECGQTACSDGIRKCQQVGQEFTAWGPCISASTGQSCGETADGSGAGGGTNDGAKDGGASSGASVPTGSCVCKPGTQRWCDDPLYCFWGRQSCTPAGTWGQCIETTDKPAGCDRPTYNLDCCVAAGQCCEDVRRTNPNAPDSVGNCAGILCG